MGTRFNHLNVPQYWRQYWDKYPEGYTILESLLNWVAQVDSMTDNVNDWNTYLDSFKLQFDKELESTVTEILSDWQTSGFLNVVISEALQTEIDTVNDRLEDLGANVKAQGVKADGVTDDTLAFKGAISLAATLKLKLIIPEGTVLLSSDVFIPSYFSIEGADVQKTVLKFTNNASLILQEVANGFVYQIKMKNLSIDGDNKASVLVKQASTASGVEECHFDNVWLTNAVTGFQLKGLNLSNFLRCASTSVDNVFDLDTSHYNNVLYGNFYEADNVFLIKNSANHLNINFVWFEGFNNLYKIDFTSGYGIDIGVIQIDNCYCLSNREQSNLGTLVNTGGNPTTIKLLSFKNNTVVFNSKTTPYFFEMLYNISDLLLNVRFHDNIVTSTPNKKWVKSTADFDFKFRGFISDNIYVTNSVGVKDGNMLRSGLDMSDPSFPLNTKTNNGLLLDNLLYLNEGAFGYNSGNKQLNYYDGTQTKTVPFSVPNIPDSTAADIPSLKNDLNTVITILRNAKLLS
jgi:hypothetical protein